MKPVRDRPPVLHILGLSQSLAPAIGRHAGVAVANRPVGEVVLGDGALIVAGFGPDNQFLVRRNGPVPLRVPVPRAIRALGGLAGSAGRQSGAARRQVVIIGNVLHSARQANILRRSK